MELGRGRERPGQHQCPWRPPQPVMGAGPLHTPPTSGHSPHHHRPWQPNFYANRTSKSWQGDWRKVTGEAYIECCFWTDWNK